MIKIEVKTTDVSTKSGISSKTGKPYTIREQEAWAHLYSVGGPHPYPSRVLITLEDNDPPYPPGAYTLDPSCLYAGRFGTLALGRIKLKALVSSAKAAA